LSKKETSESSLADRPGRGPWGVRVLGALALSVVPLVAMQGTANAAYSCVKFDGRSSNNYTQENEHWTKWSGSLRSPSHGGGNKTYNAGTDWKGKQWNRVLWKGTPYQCHPATKDCRYAWSHSKTVTTQWSVGLDIGGSLKGTTRDATAALTPGWSRTSSYSENFSWDITMYPGQYAQPVMLSKMEPQAGFIRGAYKSPGENGTKCTYPGGRGTTNHGYRAEWDPTGVVTRWFTNVRLWDFASYNIWR
jgi:hypothetical protein